MNDEVLRPHAVEEEARPAPTGTSELWPGKGRHGERSSTGSALADSESPGKTTAAERSRLRGQDRSRRSEASRQGLGHDPEHAEVERHLVKEDRDGRDRDRVAKEATAAEPGGPEMEAALDNSRDGRARAAPEIAGIAGGRDGTLDAIARGETAGALMETLEGSARAAPLRGVPSEGAGAGTDSAHGPQEATPAPNPSGESGSPATALGQGEAGAMAAAPGHPAAAPQPTVIPGAGEASAAAPSHRGAAATGADGPVNVPAAHGGGLGAHGAPGGDGASHGAERAHAAHAGNSPGNGTPQPGLALAPESAIRAPEGPALADEDHSGEDAAKPIAFAETDVGKLLPPLEEGESPDSRRQMERDAKEELAVDAATSSRSMTAFVAERRAKVHALTALRAGAQEQLKDAETGAIAEIHRSVEAETAQVGAAAAQVRAQVQAHAQQQRGRVEGHHQQTVAAIQTATQGARTALRSAFTTSLEEARAAEAAQIAHLGGLYQQAEGSFRSAAQAAGALAVNQAAERASTYRKGRINRSDGFWDGHLTDNRCEAQAEAAEKVGAGYRDELAKEGDKQGTALHRRRPTDESAVRQVTTEARRNLTETFQNALRGLESSQQQSLKNAQDARSSSLSQIGQTLGSVLAGLNQHETAQIAAIRQQGDARRQTVRQQSASSVSMFREAIGRATSDLHRGLGEMVQRTSSAEVPEPSALDASLAESGAQLDQQVDKLKQGVLAQVAQASHAVAECGAQAALAVARAGKAAADAARQTGHSASASLDLIGNTASKGLSDLVQGHQQATQGSQTAFAGAKSQIATGLQGSFGRLNQSISEGARQNAENVRLGLTAAVTKDMPGVITREAEKARAQVQPRWKSVLKWVIIIAIVLVVAIVLGPMVIGAVTGAAAALGASAGVAGAVGMVVGGALVGAATSAATTMIDNGFAGRDLTTGLGTAIVMGALGGALGGAASGLLAGPMQGMTALARYGAQVGVDMLIDTGLNAATGNLSWENFGTSLLMSAFVNGVTAHPRIQMIQHGFSSRGFGAGYGAARNIRTRVTGTGGPGSAGPVSVDASHVNRGDTAGPNSPYAGKWDMGGGGHNANEIRGRAATDGYGQATVAKDPITGVAIERFQRTQLDHAGNPVPDPANPGSSKAKTTSKSVFPESMRAPEIHAAGKTALEQAIAGAPNTTHTAPSVGPGGNAINGKFSAIVMTPEGHPIMVEGYYAPAPGGGWEIKTVYPTTNLPTATTPGSIPAVPGSRISVPGTVVTPPDTTYGDREERP